MNAPSVVSISDMPAANMSGREITAVKGSPCAAAPADASQLASAAHDPLHDRLDRKSQCDRDQEYDRRVAQGKKEAHPDRLRVLLKEFAGGVVNGRDVVGIERMSEAERVRQTPQRQEARVLGAVDEEQSPAHHVQQGHRAIEAAQPGALASVEGSPDQGPGRGHGCSLTAIAT